MSDSLNNELAITLHNLRIRCPNYCFRFNIEAWFFGLNEDPEQPAYTLYYVHNDNPECGSTLTAPSIHDLYIAFCALDPAPPATFTPGQIPKSGLNEEPALLNRMTASGEPNFPPDVTEDVGF